MPYQARRPQSKAATNDPTTWASYEDATAAAHNGDAFNGVGFVFSEDDDFAGVDLDDSIDPATGQPKPWAERIIKRLNTYTEISPSGTGVKLFLRGRKPGTLCKRSPYEDGAVEVYDVTHYFTVTMRHLAGTPETIEDRTDELAALYHEVFLPDTRKPRKAKPNGGGAKGNDAALLTRARESRNGAKFSNLYDNGDTSAYGGDDSAADLALCDLLAFWTGPDPDRIDRLFRTSRLMRDKWDSRRPGGTYGSMTIDKALEGRTIHPEARIRATPSFADGLSARSTES